MDIHAEVKALNLGSQIRQIRLGKQLTLQDISNVTGLSKPFLSQIENNLVVPPIATLLKISKALGVSISRFFQGAPSPERIALVRRGERKKFSRPSPKSADRTGYRYESLAHPMAEKHMEPFLVEIEPRDKKDLVFYNHAGEEFLYVLEGKTEFRAADRVIVIEPGDSLYFHSDIPHALRGLNGKKSIVLAVVFSPR
ncbi:MAG: helix-turn-helix transcriptional regulator [Deltaproteobacteria bacterium]|nr:helix-turn-helix transcriptional regulator [Deltaproteobacteria bacterium]